MCGAAALQGKDLAEQHAGASLARMFAERLAHGQPKSAASGAERKQPRLR